MSYETMLLNLKKGVWFFFVREGDNFYGKLFYVDTYKKHAKPQNKTAIMLLYLLSRDEGDDIHFNTLRDLVIKKFKIKEKNIDIETANKILNAFLGKLDELWTGGKIPLHKPDGTFASEKVLSIGILDKREAGGDPGTPVPDPMMLFDGDPINWEDPLLIPGHLPPIVHKTTYFALPETKGGVIHRHEIEALMVNGGTIHR